MLNKIIGYGFYFLLVLSLNACTPLKPVTEIPNKALTFDQAVKVSSHYLLSHISQQRQRQIHRLFGQSRILLEPIVGDDVDQEIAASLVLSESLRSIATTHYAKQVLILPPNEWHKHHYFIRGKITRKTISAGDIGSYQLQLTAVEERTGKVIATTQTTLLDHPINYQSEPIALNAAIDLISQQLLLGLSNDRFFKPHAVPAKVVFKPFTTENPQQTIRANRKILDTLKQQLSRNKTASGLVFSLSNASQTPVYAIEGQLLVAVHPTSKQKHYKLQATAKEVASGAIIARADSWISNPLKTEVRFTSLPLHKALTHTAEHLLTAVQQDRLYQPHQTPIILEVDPLRSKKQGGKLSVSDDLFKRMTQVAATSAYREDIDQLIMPSAGHKSIASQYVIKGTVEKGLNPKTKKSSHRLQLWVQNQRTEKRLATAEFWVDESSHDYTNQPRSFNNALIVSSQYLLAKIQQDWRFKPGSGKAKVVIDSFVDGQSLDEVESSRLINKKFIQIAQSTFGMKTHRLSANALPVSDYIVQGYLSLDTYPDTNKKMYKIQSIVRHIKSGQRIATADAWINTNNLNYKRTPEYQDRPIFSLATTQQYQQRLQRLTRRKQATALQYELKTKSLLNDAGQAYAKGRYRKALGLYQIAQQRKGEEIRTYAGLYLSSLRLGSVDKAEKAFQNLIKWNLFQRDALSVRMLFAVNSTKFSGDRFLKQQYDLWIKNIGRYFSIENKCFSIIGHSSHTGSATYNKTLSMARSQAVKKLLQPHFTGDMRAIKAIGRGFSENISGLGTDDQQDAIDRRVEFIKGCS